jgi:hypothetical protein
MAQKKILTIGFELASDEVAYTKFDSDISLLDWDIILFKPAISEFLDGAGIYQGKPNLSDSRSFRLKERVEHWRREINSAVESGKTVITFLSDLTEVYIDTGRREYSGTGRNQQTKRIVEIYNNYQAIPAKLYPIKTKGSEIKLAHKGAEVISSYWQEFSDISNYKVVLNEEKVPSCLLTKHGDKSVGAIYRSKNSSGALILLPDIDFYPDNFFEEEKDPVHRRWRIKPEWNQEANRFASRFIKSVVVIDQTIKNVGELTPEPEWSRSPEFSLNKESKIVAELLKIEEEIERLQSKKEFLVAELKDAVRLRNLLFEKGKPLEYAILEALKILGFAVSQYDDGKSEFDAVFESKEGRLIGEAEGKDNKAINIDKLRQLALNIHEDLEREDVETPAKAVLFGNAYRLQPITERGETFTLKCLSASAISSIALVDTPSLFAVAQYLSHHKNARYATSCRKAIINTVGKVEFPSLPDNLSKTDLSDISESET